jgi:hypothetical protein
LENLLETDAFVTVTKTKKMRATLPLLVRIVPRSSITPSNGRKVEIIPEPAPQQPEKKDTLISALMKQREAMGDSWPPNLRIEPVVTKKTFERVHADYRTELKALLKET